MTTTNSATINPVKWLWIGYVWPEEQSSAAGVRTLELIRYLKRNGQEVHFASAAKNEKNAPALLRADVKTHAILLNDSSFDAFVKDLSPDVVVYDRFVTEEQYGWRVRKELPNVLSILDTQDLHFLRRNRQNGTSTPFTEDFYREVASILRCDRTLLVSDFEESLLKKEFGIPEDLLQTVPIGYPVSSHSSISFENRRDFCWIGNFQHAPNTDGLKIFLNSIWPLIRRQKPDAQVHVYGAYITQEFSEKHDPANGVLMKGWIENPEETLARYRVNLAPLRFGAGTKGKIAQGWASGTPVVTTDIGREGLVREDKFGGKAVELEAFEVFAQECIRLHDEEKTWQEARAAGLNLIRTYFDSEKIGAMFLDSVNSLRGNLDAHRKKHWMSAVLNLQNMRSTEFFSRWIEAKEKNR